MKDTLKLIWANLRHLAVEADLIGLRALVSMSSIAWGIMWVVDVCNSNTFMTHKYTSYNLLETVMPDWLWATLFLLHGGVSMTGLLLKKSGLMYVLLDPLLGALLWTCSSSVILMVFILSMAYPPAMLVTHMLVSLCTLWILIRVPYALR